MAESLLPQTPRVLPPLHPEFQPAVLGNRAFRAAAASRSDAHSPAGRSDAPRWSIDRRR